MDFDQTIRGIFKTEFEANQPAIEALIRKSIGGMFATMNELLSKTTAPTKTGAPRGRPRKVAAVKDVSARLASVGRKLRKAKPEALKERITKLEKEDEGDRAGRPECAIKGCDGDVRTRGVCSKHYQQFRNLEKTDRLPVSWAGIKDGTAAPQSAEAVSLPRGRASHKAAA